MSVATLNAKRDAAITALEASDYAAAIRYAMEAKLILATMPNVNREGQSLGWNSTGIDSFISQVRQLQASIAAATGGPFVQIPVTYERPATSGEYE